MVSDDLLFCAYNESLAYLSAMSRLASLHNISAREMEMVFRAYWQSRSCSWRECFHQALSQSVDWRQHMDTQTSG